MSNINVDNLIQSIKAKLNESGVSVNSFKEINYGIQFLLDNGQNFRVYYNKKGRIKYDVSQIRDNSLVLDIQKIFGIEAADIKANQNIEFEIKYPNIGTDESGKGDLFGPLVIAGVLLTKHEETILLSSGIKDSKKISDKKIRLLAVEVKKVVKDYSIVVIKNQRYNTFHEDTQNVNTMLAWGHARTIENILDKNKVNYIYSDQFGSKKLIENAMLKKGREVELYQQHKAEIITSVAAASILARNRFLSELEDLKGLYGMDFPKGASNIANTAMENFVELHGYNELKNVAKLHFSNTKKMNQANSSMRQK